MFIVEDTVADSSVGSARGLLMENVFFNLPTIFKPLQVSVLENGIRISESSIISISCNVAIGGFSFIQGQLSRHECSDSGHV